MKKFLVVFLCICAFFAACLLLSDKEEVTESAEEQHQSQTALLKKGLEFEDLDGGEDEGIILLTGYVG